MDGVWITNPGCGGSNPLRGANLIKFRPRKNQNMSQWTEELKQQVIEEYEASNPTPENTTEIIEELAEKHEKTVNGTRLILSKAGVYIAQASKSNSTTNSSSGDKTPRKSKQDSLDELTALLVEHGVTVDDTIISRMTGKAAEFVITSIKHVIEN